MKLWKEMHGCCMQEIRKVMKCFEEHLEQELSKIPQTIQEFTKNLETRAYTKGDVTTPTISIQQATPSTHSKPQPRSTFYDINLPIIINEVHKRNSLYDAPAFIYTAKLVEDRILELIRKQRLAYMVQGQSFYHVNKAKPKGKDKSIFCRLSPNHKLLLYRDMSDCKKNVDNETLFTSNDMISVTNIVKVQTSDEMEARLIPSGVEVEGCTSYMSKLTELMKVYELGISISFKNKSGVVNERDSNLTLIAPNKKVYDYWCDGINILMKKEMKSTKFKEEYKALEYIELRMNYIEVDKKDNTKPFPKVPPPPSNFNFSGKY